MRKEIDPKTAIADFDALTLVSWTLEPLEPPRFLLTVEFTGGLGRATNLQGEAIFINELETTHTTRILPELSNTAQGQLTEILTRWQEVGVPLRLLELPDALLLVEDGQTYISLPPSDTHSVDAREVEQ